jgi:hypothetical protein
MAVGAPVYVQICTAATNPCPIGSESVVLAYLINPAYQTQTEIMLNQSGIDWTAVYDAFGMSLLMFATGLGVGLIYNQVKKLR